MRKESQASRLYRLLMDCRAHSTFEILRVVYGSEHLGVARIGGRIHDVKKLLPENMEIISWPNPKHRTEWFYQLRQKPPEQHDVHYGLFGEAASGA